MFVLGFSPSAGQTQEPLSLEGRGRGHIGTRGYPLVWKIGIPDERNRAIPVGM